MTKTILLSTIAAASLLSGCVEKEKLTDLGDAENILFTSEGELLVTGGKSIYHIEVNTDSHGNKTYTPVKAYDGKECSFTGIAQNNDWIFTVCSQTYLKWEGWTFKLGVDTQLMAANITHEGPTKFKRLDTDWASDPLDTLVIPNGLAFTPDGKLLIADENLIGQGNVGRITLDYSGDWPAISKFEKDWIGAEYGIKSPNGVRVADNTVYVSNESKVHRFVFDHQYQLPMKVTLADGTVVSNAPEDNVIYQGGLIIDDIMPYCGGVAITKFFEGQLTYIAANGEVVQTPPLSFESPSSLAIGQGPNFSGYDLLVTEKGVLMENNSGIGNQLSKVPMDIDLNDPLTCHVISEM